MSTYVLEMQGNEGKLVSAFKQSRAAATQFDDAIAQLTGGTYRLNEAAGRFTKEGAPGFIKNIEVLNSLGIRTTAQIQQEIKALDLLATRYQHDAMVTAALTQRKEMLNAQINRTAVGATKSGQAIITLGYIINDAQQFTFGFAEGLRAVSNNLQPLIYQLAPTGAGMAAYLPWVVVGVNAATTAIVLWSKALKGDGGATKATRDYKDELEGVADALFKIKYNMPTFEAQTLEAARMQAEAYKGHIERLNEEITSGEGLTDFMVMGARVRTRRTLTEEEIEQRKKDLADYQALYDDAQRKIAEIEDSERLVSKIRETGVEGVKETNDELEQQLKKLRELRKEEYERRRALDDLLNKYSKLGEVKYTPPELMGSALLTSDIRSGGYIQTMGGSLPELIFTKPDLLAAQWQAGSQALRRIPDEVAEEMQRLDAELRKGDDTMSWFVGNFSNHVMDLSGAIQGGLTDAIVTFSSSIPDLLAGTQTLTAVGGKIIGDFAQQVGATMVALGTAGFAAKLFAKNPAGVIIAGASLIAIGSALKSSLDSQGRNFGSNMANPGGYSAWRTIPANNDPYGNGILSSPLSYSKQSVTVVVEGELKAKGGDMYAVINSAARTAYAKGDRAPLAKIVGGGGS